MILEKGKINAPPENNKDNNCTIELKRRIRDSVKQLRDEYYRIHGMEPLEHGYPFGGKPTESVGSFAEYNLRSIHCKRSKAGLCTPCFYSKFPDVIDINEKEKPYISFIKEQIDYIIDNFEDTIENKQKGRAYYRTEDLTYSSKEPVACCITPVGSFFDENEFPTRARRYLLERLVNISEIIQRDIILYVESHVLDFCDYMEQHVTDTERNLFHKLHVRIIFGFESKNDYVRNVLYGKELELCKFESAVQQAKEAGFGAYAFTFFGLYPMSHKEILADAKESFQYLLDLGVTPVVMFANIQDYTIAGVLANSKKYRLISPITVLDVVRLMINIFGRVRDDGYDAWLMADPVGGPPDPAYHIFSDIKTKCCSDKILSLIRSLRDDHEYAGVDEIYNQVSRCQLHQASNENLLQLSDRSLIERTEEMIGYIENVIPQYLKTLRDEEILSAKAHLLCEGAIINGVTRKALNEIGVTDGFIHSTNILIDEVSVNACLMESFVSQPSCEIIYKNKCFYLKYNSDDLGVQPELIGEIDFIPIPEWGEKYIDEYKISDYLRPHSRNCISIWPNQRCAFVNGRCKFCSLPRDGVCLTPETVVRMIDAALEFNPLYEVHLSGGVYKSALENTRYYSDIAGMIHAKHPDVKISLETIPPLSNNDFKLYKENGIGSILMNIELANEVIRKEICPEKSLISLARYKQSFREAVDIFGKWNVGSVIMTGIEGVTHDDIVNLAQELCVLGVYPVIMPFQPLKDSQMYECDASNPQEYMQISEEIGGIIRMYSENDSLCSFGCINCGACSIEKYYNNRKIKDITTK